MKKISRFLPAILAVSLVFSGCGAKQSDSTQSKETSSGDQAAQSADTIKIGVLAPTTGFMSTHGEVIKLSAELAEELINNDGGIAGKKVKMIIEDDKSDPSVATEKAKQLINKDKVNFLIGTGSSAETLAVVPVAEQSKVPFIYSLDGECKTCSLSDKNQKSKYIFASGPTPQMLLDKFLPSMMNKFGKKVYFVGADYVFPHFMNDIAEKIVKDNGGEVVGSEYAPTDTTDYSPIINRVKKADPDILFLTLPGTSGVTFVKQARQFGIFEKMAVTGSATFDTEAYSAIGQISDSVYVVNRYTDLLDNSENKKFVEAYKAKYNPKYPIGPTASSGTYGVVMAIKAAVEKAGSTDPDKVVVALEGLKLNLPQGEVEIDKENHVFNQHIYMMQIKDNDYQLVEDLGITKHPGFEGCSVGQ
ncbi:substrate-binding protein [Brevibacillus massiliensis]|uniref:substrate-binding protein n=1 Tax=Brevibacillus massiliensis TaxID=1118054 RepID=UPI0002F1E5A9|nr:substrate-binding protein [Brevibacillus massiliensis]